MEHTYTCIYDMVWHDLTEDPRDLPTKDNYETYILTRDIETGELDKFFCYDLERYGADYDPTACVWTTAQYTYYGNLERVIAFKSFGIEPVVANIQMYDELSKREVVAWAEEVVKTTPPDFIPAIFRKN